MARKSRILAKLAGWGSWEIGPIPREAAPGLTSIRDVCATFKNRQYSVQVVEHATDLGLVRQFMIRRHDGQPCHNWRDLQRIKNELVGSERMALEIYPPQSEVVDTANIYHLWVMPEGFVLPFGMTPAK